ncbi:MAG: hypothetical protein KIT09_22380 [Bryobacteraceae bacterium]|nr:hypothetical protein [Bryobacteraceae bacterium]
MINRRDLFRAAGFALAPAPGSDPLPRTEPVDFRYSPLSWQTAINFPDDPYKTLVGERGELRYGHQRGKGIDYFPTVVSFSMRGMEGDGEIVQRLESPGVPIVQTQVERPNAIVELTAFASRRESEGRVDNVIVKARPRSGKLVHVIPVVHVRTRRDLVVRQEGGVTLVHLDSASSPVCLMSNLPMRAEDVADGFRLSMADQEAPACPPFHCILRFPQEGQDAGRLLDGLNKYEDLLGEARWFWRTWKPLQDPVDWKLPGEYGNFLTASGRNILQARERVDGRLRFQVGPTVYRGLWVVDGHFILEAARYLGHDNEAQQGLEATWALQQSEGGIFAGGGTEHWKDTAIAMFSMVRQAELSQDWSYFRKMKPELLRAVRFLVDLREKGRGEDSANGRYGLLPRGMGDGGLGGLRSEFTNTLWTLAGLKALIDAAAAQRLDGFSDAERFYSDLRACFTEAVKKETRVHPAGFDYLPMLMREDPQWGLLEPWARRRPQVAQWALSHCIYPGLLFERGDPVVRGHIALMQHVTQEDIPAETGWLPHEGVWNYNAAFVAHVYLWAGLREWARAAFHGFLNHATPLYCWREEQPVRGSLVARYIGDMPHNWASAECALYLRHMLALEDGKTLRLLAGIGAPELAAGEPYALTGSPTRFGRVGLRLEPLSGGRGWRLEFQRSQGPQPSQVQLPAMLGPAYSFREVKGATAARRDDLVIISPAAAVWSAEWRS